MSTTLPSELTDLPLMLRPREAAPLLGVSIGQVYQMARDYTARVEAIEAKTGQRPAYGSPDFLPRENEIAAIRIASPHLVRDGKPRGGAVRIYRDPLLEKVWGIRGGEAA